MGFRFSASCNGKREGKALKIKKKREEGGRERERYGA